MCVCSVRFGMSCISPAFIKRSLITLLFASENFISTKIVIENNLDVCSQAPMGDSPSAVCVCSKISVCVRTAIVYVLSVCTQALYGHARRKNILCFCICVWRCRAWVTARCRFLNRGYEWVPPPAKSCQSDGERGAPLNPNRVELQMRRTSLWKRPIGRIDNGQTAQTNTGEWLRN